jgi:hypothetical protein
MLIYWGKQIIFCKLTLDISEQRTSFVIQELYFLLLRIKSVLITPAKMIFLLYIFNLRM